MPGQTPVYGLPYAVGGDARRDFPAVVNQPQMEAVEAELELRPYHLARGSFTTGVVTTPYEGTITFPAGRFSASPAVFLQTYEAQVFMMTLVAVSETGATIKVVGADGSTGGSVIVRAWWLAVGN